ncbi:AAA domain-containing protein [Arthrobacter sp. GMC3]|uniref:AAA domain-containing protein n=1 Tax=Arthrobacter sp. GMC3 TaxID=2058894 RepID=UPI000CE2FDB7|nr:AAA domain-containing protein [Arthrobacter sp. GMC3]
MIDPRHEAIFVRPSTGGAFEDKTAVVVRYRMDPNHVCVTFKSGQGEKEYRYGLGKVVIVRAPARIQIGKDTQVAVRGNTWARATEAWRFDGPDGAWWRIFYPTQTGPDSYRSYPGCEVEFRQNATNSTGASGVLSHWKGVVAGLSADDPLQRSYNDLHFVDRASALGRYLNAEPIESSNGPDQLIFPFSSNLSQRAAVQTCLSNPVSVIDGPPGTGKTQTILNLIANIISTPGATVGVVSFNNAAVDNVREKLEKAGFGHVVAGLGRSEKRAEFFAEQSPRNAQVAALANSPKVPMPTDEQIADVDRRLQLLQETERQLAQLRQQRDAYQLELRHFSQHLLRHEPANLEGLPLLKQSSGLILDYLAETAQWREGDGPFRRLFRRVRGYFRYGSTKSIDPGDTDTVLGLQRAYYSNKIGELQHQIEQAERTLTAGGLASLAQEHQLLSVQAFRAGLHQRYSKLSRQIYEPTSYKRLFASFAQDYPVILSTCHSLGRSLPDGYLLDYLIIDEASQVDLLAAGLALKSARNVIVVGDLRQIQHISNQSAYDGAAAAPAPAYDYLHHNILSSMIALYGDTLPRTMLREHYRCDPAIIGFCNKKYYNGQLVPFTMTEPGEHPLRVVRTVAGNHMRAHREGGRSNQREIDVVAQEVIQQFFAETDPEAIGIATPYRLQANKLNQQLVGIEASTVHKFQGREKDVVIMSTVLDETTDGRQGLQFVDDPHLVNVAVSRAAKQFVLVTNRAMLPKSRHLRDLIDYIRYHDPEQEVFDSSVVSIFDLLYRDYSPRLRPLADQLQKRSEFASENIAWTLLNRILAEESYADFTVVDQVVLHNLLPDLSKLTPEQAAYVKRRATIDFVVYNRISNKPAFAVEVDGFAFHENNPAQLIRDALKNAICSTHQIPLLRLTTTGSGEEDLIRKWLDSSA